MAKFGLVTVLFNSNDVLDEFLASLSIQGFQNFKLYLVDNSYSHESEKYILEALKKVTFQIAYLPQKKNIGIAAGNNVGIKQSLKDECDAVILLNNDIDFDDKYLLSSFETNFITGKSVIVPKIYFDGTNKIWFLNGKINIFKANVTHFHDQVEDVGQFISIKETLYSPTCFMLIDSKIFEQVGLMDESFFVYMDDVDFVYRLSKVNQKIYVLEDKIINHKVGFSSGGSTSDFSFSQMLKNRILFIEKHYEGRFLRLISKVYVFVSQFVRSVQIGKIRLFFGTCFK